MYFETTVKNLDKQIRMNMKKQNNFVEGLGILADGTFSLKLCTYKQDFVKELSQLILRLAKKRAA